MFNKHDLSRNEGMLTGSFAKRGYDWWWHSFTAISEETGLERPFFIEFFTCNPALAEDAPVLGQLPENKAAGKKPSYLMVKAGCWGQPHMQLHRFFPWNEVDMHSGQPYSVTADDCCASEHKLTGHVSISHQDAFAHPEWMCDAGEISWDLTMEKDITFNVGYGASKPMRLLKAFEMYWHAEGIKTLYSGTVIMNGERYKVTPETSYGYADKNWGRNFTSPWVWLASNHLVSRRSGRQLMNSAFDIGGGRPKVYFLPLNRKLLGVFCYEGIEYEFNFSKFWMHVKTTFYVEELDDEVEWHVIQENRRSLMETTVRCDKKDMLLINYESPDGEKRHNRLWNGGNGRGRIRLCEKIAGRLVLIDDIDAFNVGCEYGEYDK
ncbi:MAG: tocopherol cyclase family protein [Anaerovoracaceae bacterium]|jgi:tocopherol cyclase